MLETPPPVKNRKIKDLRFRLAYTKPELSLVLPFGHTTLEEMIKRGTFPDGIRPHPSGHKIWPKNLITELMNRVMESDAVLRPTDA